MIRQVVVACAYSLPAASSSRPSAVAMRLPTCSTLPIAHEIRLRLERGVARARRHLRVDAAAHRRVEQRHGEAAVHDADRVVVLLARRHLEDRVTWLDHD